MSESLFLPLKPQAKFVADDIIFFFFFFKMSSAAVVIGAVVIGALRVKFPLKIQLGISFHMQ